MCNFTFVKCPQKYRIHAHTKKGWCIDLLDSLSTYKVYKKVHALEAYHSQMCTNHVV